MSLKVLVVASVFVTVLLGRGGATAWSAGLNFGTDAGALAAAEEDVSMESPPVRKARFSEGSWFFQTMGSVAFGDENGELYTGHVGVGYFLFDDFSISLDAVGGYIEVEEGHISSETFLGLDLLLRHHVLKGDKWSFYIDVGGGLQQSSDRFPVGGTHFNFRPQAGVGATFELGPRTLLMTGCRWFHVSNASRKGTARNPGYDSAQLYVGVMVPF